MDYRTMATTTYTLYEVDEWRASITGWAKSNRNWWHALDLLEGQKTSYTRKYLCGAGRGKVMTYDHPAGEICPDCRAVLTRRVVES